MQLRDIERGILRTKKLHKVTAFVVDHDALGATNLEIEMLSIPYPNDCIRISQMSVETVDVGEWSDDHPANMSNTDLSAYFEETPDQKEVQRLHGLMRRIDLMLDAFCASQDISVKCGELSADVLETILMDIAAGKFTKAAPAAVKEEAPFQARRVLGAPIHYYEGPNIGREITEQESLQEGLQIIAPTLFGSSVATITKVSRTTAEAQSGATLVHWLEWQQGRELWVATGSGNLKAVTRINFKTDGDADD